MKKLKGYALLGVTILGLILVSIAALLQQKSTYINIGNRAWLERRALLLEVDSLTKVLKEHLETLDATGLTIEDNNFLNLTVEDIPRWNVARKAGQNNLVEFEIYFIPKDLHFKKSVKYP